MPANILLQKYESEQQRNIRKNGLCIEQQVQLSDHSWNISCLQFSNDGMQLASGSWDKTGHIWNLNSLDKPVKKLGVHEDGHKAPLTCLSWLPQVDCLLCSGSADSSLILWNTGSGDPIAKLQEHNSWILGMSCTNDGKLLASSCWDGDVIVWDIDLTKPVCKLIGHSNGVWACCFSRTNNSVLCTASEDCSLRIWDMREDRTWHSDMVLSGVHSDAIKTCCWSPCGNYLAAGSKDQKISIWDNRANKAINCLDGHNGGISDLSYLSTSSSILFSVGGVQCCVWDVFNPKAECIGSLQQHTWSYEVESLALSPDATLLATAGVDKQIVISSVDVTDSFIAGLQRDINGLPFAQIPVKTQSMLSTSPDNRSSACILDQAIAESESRERIQSEIAAKQTVRIKYPVTSELLQAKLFNLKAVPNQKKRLELAELFKTASPRTPRHETNQCKSKELVTQSISNNNTLTKTSCKAVSRIVNETAQKSLISELQTKVRHVNDAKDEKVADGFVNDQMNLSATY